MSNLRSALLALVLLTTACDSTEPARSTLAPAAAAPVRAAAASPQRGDAPQAVTVADRPGAKQSAPRPAGERPLPSFKGRTLSGTRFKSSSLIGRRSLLFFFNPEDENAAAAADAVVALSKRAKRNNFRVVGIGVGSYASKVRAFATKHGMDFTIVDDSDANITSIMRLPTRLVVMGSDAEGYLTFFKPLYQTTDAKATERVTAMLRVSMRIADPDLSKGGQLLDYPVAPTFSTQDIDGAAFDLADLAGKPIVLIFFLHTCPHCHTALRFFEKRLADMPEDKRPALVAISLQDRPSVVRRALQQEGLDFFTPLVDPGGSIQQSYGLEGAVPDISLIDSGGLISYRVRGWREDRDPALMRMRLANIADTRAPMLLSRKGYSGNDVCIACHELEGATWAYTKHSKAFDTLVTHGDERDAECVGCHVVGFEEPGGFEFAKPQKFMESVGCESCHGRGGPHLTEDFEAPEDYKDVCLGCHNAEHSLGFEYSKFLPHISHEAIAELTPKERAGLSTGGGDRALLPTKADYVGSNACQSCHESEFATWSSDPHANAMASLEEKGKTKSEDCLKCHTTGFGLSGGFKTTGAMPDADDLARVGCESCHGPGSDHISEDAPRFDTILSLGDKCDSCVILKICGDCHDEANDADFEFEVEEHIDRQRHGTTEPGTSKPLGTSAQHELIPGGAVLEFISDALPAEGQQASNLPDVASMAPQRPRKTGG